MNLSTNKKTPDLKKKKCKSDLILKLQIRRNIYLKRFKNYTLQ